MSKDDNGRELQKHTLHLFAGQYARLGELFPKTTPARVIRHLVDNLINGVKGERPDLTDIDISD